MREDPDGRTYKDFEIGQTVLCSGPTCESDDSYIDPGWWLTIGKEYVINDVDFHFPNSIAVGDDRNKPGFFPIRLFDGKQAIRQKIIDSVLDN